MSDISPKDLALRLVSALGREKESPLGPCSNRLHFPRGCVREIGQNRMLVEYCTSCRGYMLAVRLESLLAHA